MICWLLEAQNPFVFFFPSFSLNKKGWNIHLEAASKAEIKNGPTSKDQCVVVWTWIACLAFLLMITFAYLFYHSNFELQGAGFRFANCNTCLFHASLGKWMFVIESKMKGTQVIFMLMIKLSVTLELHLVK